MLSREAEEVLIRQSVQRHELVIVVSTAGRSVLLDDGPLGEDADSQRKYVLAINELVHHRLAELVGDNAYDLTLTGRNYARGLTEDHQAQNSVPDACVITVHGTRYKVDYVGADPDMQGDDARVHHVLQFGGRTYDAHAGVFHVNSGEERCTCLVLLDSLNVPNIGEIKNKEVFPKECLDLLFKRPGLRAVRESLMQDPRPAIQRNLLYPKLDLRQGATVPKTLEEYVDMLDDSRAEILRDCEKDVLEMLLKDRRERELRARTASDVARSPDKQRFYDVRAHIRATLSDLADKGLIRTHDGVGYEIDVRRMADAKRVIEGLPSDDLFGDPPAAQLAASTAKSTAEYDAFLCHASEDREAMVAPFAAAMIAAGLKPWIDRKNLKWGDDLVARIQEGLSRSRFVIVFITEAFLSKKWPEKELNTALSMEIGGKTVVLPVLAGLTHDTLQSRYPIVSAKLYREVSPYNPEKEVARSTLDELVGELKKRLEDK